MSSNKKINYLHKFPKLSEYDVKLFSPIFMLAVIPIAMMYLYSLKEITTDYLVQIIFFLPILYLLVTMSSMIFKIDMLLIKINNACEENLNLSRNTSKNIDNLLICEEENKKYIHDKIVPFALIILAVLFLLSKKLMIDMQYIKWELGYVLIIFLSIRFKDISHFFYNLANSSYQVIIRDNKFVEALSKKDITNWKTFENKWRKFLALNILLLILTIVIFSIFKDLKGMISSFSLLILAIITFKMALDVNTIVKSNIETMGEYDEHIKNKLGIIIHKSKKMHQDDTLDIISHVPDIELTFPNLEKIFKKILRK